MKILKFVFCTLLLASMSWGAAAQEYKIEKDLYYKDTGADAYSKERCRLDVYYPAGEKGFKTLVWFHGGGLTSGGKHIPVQLKERGICVVAVNYRLSPKAQHPAYIEDAAAAVAWVMKHIAEYGGDPRQIYISGHSAGGYLVSMVGLDKKYMKAYGVDPDSLAGVYPISGQAITHFTIRAERGLSGDIPLIDEYAPLAHVRKGTAPILIVTGDTELEMKSRAVEGRYLYEALEAVGNDQVEHHELSGFSHNSVIDPAMYLVLHKMGVR